MFGIALFTYSRTKSRRAQTNSYAFSPRNGFHMHDGSDEWNHYVPKLELTISVSYVWELLRYRPIYVGLWSQWMCRNNTIPTVLNPLPYKMARLHRACCKKSEAIIMGQACDCKLSWLCLPHSWGHRDPIHYRTQNHQAHGYQWNNTTTNSRHWYDSLIQKTLINFTAIKWELIHNDKKNRAFLVITGYITVVFACLVNFWMQC